MEEIQWNDRFNIGVDDVDHAHQRLFLIVRKLTELNKDTAKKKYACQEGIKYFKSYTIKHFASEERYMQFIKYDGYEMHKRLHDDLRDKTLPALERELEESDYSDETIQHFIGICIGWLTGHIMIEDRAITGRVSSKWTDNYPNDEQHVLEESVGKLIEELFGLRARLVSEHYGGEEMGKEIIFRLSYRAADNKPVQVFLVYEEHLVLHMFSEMLGKNIYKVDRTVIYALKQLSILFVHRIWESFRAVEPYKLEKDNVLGHDQLLIAFEKKYPRFSLLYNVGKGGYFAFSIKQFD